MFKVLIAEDDIICSKILEKNLNNWGYHVFSTTNGKEAWQTIEEQKIQLLIIDWMMPEINGVELCKKIRELKTSEYIYIILLTAKNQLNDIKLGFDAGVDDYITKPFNQLELQSRLKAGRRIIELQNQSKILQSQLARLAHEDSLTGIWNKRMFLRLLIEEIERSKRENSPISIIILDVDNFKRINDSYGHYVGDEVLKEIASRLKSKIRLYDEIGRYGGDEFVVILPKCTSQRLNTIMKRLSECVAGKPVKTESGLLKISISQGAVSSENLTDISSQNLIKISDNALYQAKNSGRNCYIQINYNVNIT